MKEHPILFSGEMVRAILEGRKTQTRRVINPQIEVYDDKVYQRRKSGTLDEYYFGEFLFKNPYGNIGDRLWVREAFAKSPAAHIYKADFNVKDGFGSSVVNMQTGETIPLIWKPSIHMPRSFSRITLEIVNVKFERLQEITRDDAKAEGVSNIWSWTPDRKHDYHRRGLLNPYVANYSVLWDEIHEKSLIGDGWNANPWVWVIEFKRLETVHAS